MPAVVGVRRKVSEQGSLEDVWSDIKPQTRVLSEAGGINLT